MNTPNLHSHGSRQSSAEHMAEIFRRSVLIADAAAVSDIETGAATVADDPRWYDVRPMLDEREHSPQVIDMATEMLAYAEQRGLIQRHQVEPHLVRIDRRG